jgi:peptide chain release factor 1
MFEKLIGVEERFVDVEKLLSDPKIVQDREAYQKYVREHGELNKIVTVYRQYKQTLQALEDSQELLKDADPEIKELARDEIAGLTRDKEALEIELKTLLLPKDPMTQKMSF